MYLYHYPDIWYDYATWHAKNGSIDSAIKIFQRALKALPGIIYFFSDQSFRSLSPRPVFPEELTPVFSYIVVMLNPWLGKWLEFSFFLLLPLFLVLLMNLLYCVMYRFRNAKICLCRVGRILWIYSGLSDISCAFFFKYWIFQFLS